MRNARDHPDAPRWPRGALTDSLLVAALGVALYVPLLLALLDGGSVLGFNDFPAHMERAGWFELWPFSPPVPNFLTHLLIRLLTLGGLVPLDTATAVLTLAARAA